MTHVMTAEASHVIRGQHDDVVVQLDPSPDESWLGLYRRGASQLYVHTGAGYWLLPWRLGITPEIVLIELHRR